MKREVKISLLVILLVVDVLGTLLLLKNNLNTYAIVTGTLFLVILIGLFSYIKNTRSTEVIYKSKLNQFLKCYDAILVKSNNFPKLSDKNIIKIASMEDLVDAQAEIRKPIYYRLELGASSFVLLDSNEALIYILKESDDKVSSLEVIINELEKAKKDDKNIDASILENIEKTTIIKLENSKAFKVSPIRDKNDDRVSKVDEDFIETL